MSRKVRSGRAAVQLLVDDLRRAASCVTKDVLLPVGLKDSVRQGPIAITFPGAAARARVARDLWISVAMEVEARRDDPETRSWRTHTIRYDYALFAGKQADAERLSYHYHPTSGVVLPHLHVNVRPRWAPRGLRKKHLPTGRVAFEDFVEVLIEEFDVRPKRDDWRSVLDQNREVFRDRRTW